jgi:hypothetical protein
MPRRQLSVNPTRTTSICGNSAPRQNAGRRMETQRWSNQMNQRGLILNFDPREITVATKLIDF